MVQENQTSGFENLQDRTDLMQTQQALEASKADYRYLIDHAVDGILIGDSRGFLIVANTKISEMTGYTIDELLTKHIRDLFTPESLLEKPLRFDILNQGLLLVNERELLRKDGSTIPTEMNSRKLPDGRYQAFFRDITERKKAEKLLHETEERLRQAEKMEAIGKLAGGIAHDINNQVAGIMGYAELLSMKTEPPLSTYSEGIVKTCHRIAETVGRLLSFARKGTYIKTPVDMHRLIFETASILSHSIDKRIRIRQSLDACSAIVMGDQHQLQNVLLNIAINSRDAMPDGGELLFATKVVSPSDTSFFAEHRQNLPSGKYLEIAISDTGIGMDEQIQRHIFEPFFTTKEPGQGTGMGLASVYGAVTAHSGSISVSSAPGKGTVMTILLPLFEHEETTSAEQGEQDAQPGEHSKLQVMVVDDEPTVCIILCEMLKELGHVPHPFNDAIEALAFFQDQPKLIDLVILDMIMPNKNGAQTFAELRAIRSEVKVLLVSGFSIDGEAHQLIGQGANGFLQKPFGLSALRRELAIIFGREE